MMRAEYQRQYWAWWWAPVLPMAFLGWNESAGPGVHTFEAVWVVR